MRCAYCNTERDARDGFPVSSTAMCWFCYLLDRARNKASWKRLRNEVLTDRRAEELQRLGL